MAELAAPAIARAYSLMEGRVPVRADGSIPSGELTAMQRDAHNAWSDRQRRLWELDRELERLDAVLTRTEGRRRTGGLSESQSKWVRDGVEPEAAPLRAKIAELRRLDEVLVEPLTVATSEDDPLAHWDLLWRLRSLRGPINWTVRREQPADAPMALGDASAVLGTTGEALPSAVRRVLTRAEDQTGVSRVNAMVADAVQGARAVRKGKDKRGRRSA